MNTNMNMMLQGTWDICDGPILVRDPAHHVADDPAPRVRSGSEVRPIRGPRAARLRAETRAVDSAPPAAYSPGWL